MRTEELRTQLIRRPFETFRIRTSDGSVHIVEDPEFALISKDGRTLTLHDKIEPDHSVKLIDIMLITPLEIGSPF